MLYPESLDFAFPAHISTCFSPISSADVIDRALITVVDFNTVVASDGASHRGVNNGVILSSTEAHTSGNPTASLHYCLVYPPITYLKVELDVTRVIAVYVCRNRISSSLQLPVRLTDKPFPMGCQMVTW